MKNIQSDVPKPDIYYLMGLIDQYAGNTEKAKKYFQDGMKLDPDNKNCLI